VQIRVLDGIARIHTRNGHDYTGTFPEIARAACALDNCIIDGEICAVDKDGLTDFCALQAAMKSDKTDHLILFAFDLLWVGNVDLRGTPLMARKARLHKLLHEYPEQSAISFVDHLEAAGATCWTSHAR
jgi:bifunctional non-homologous end joining protein LigD